MTKGNDLITSKKEQEGLDSCYEWNAALQQIRNVRLAFYRLVSLQSQFSVLGEAKGNVIRNYFSGRIWGSVSRRGER